MNIELRRRKTCLAACGAALFFMSGAGAVWASSRHTVVTGDTLWDLAGKFYGDSFEWGRIAQANPPPSVNDPHWIYPGQVIVIPDMEAREPLPEAVSRPADPEPIAAPPQPRRPSASAKAPWESQGLSENLPPSLTPQFPSVARFKAPPGWSAHGTVLESKDGRQLLIAGDRVEVRMTAPFAAGGRFGVFRESATQDIDREPKSRYLIRIGSIELQDHLSGQAYRAIVLEAGDPIQAGDWVRREEDDGI